MYTPREGPDKRAARQAVRTGRRRRGSDRTADARRATILLDLDALRAARCVAGYVAVGDEPDVGAVLEALRARGVPVLLPRLLPDSDLDWVEWAPGQPLVRREPTPRLLEPAGPGCGVEAIGAADVVLVPALAVSRDGIRLGQGGGSYDRALARAPRALRVAVVNDDEVLDVLPEQAHDQRVHLAATPTGVVRLGSGTLPTGPP